MRVRTVILSGLFLITSCDGDGGGAGGLLLSGAVLVLAPALAFMSVRKGWRSLPAELKTNAPAQGRGDSAGTRLRHAWVGLLDRAIRSAAARYKSHLPLASALAQAANSIRTFAGPTEALAVAGSNAGQLRSWLGMAGRCGVYVLIFPGKHDQPSAFRAHPGLSAGWLRHLEALRERLAAEAQAESVLALIAVVPADARKGELLVSFDDGNLRVAPSVMLDAQEMTRPGWTILHDHIPLDFERAEAS